MHTTLLAILFTCLAAMQAVAKVASIPLDELVRRSDLIVVAKVESVIKPPFRRRYAKAVVAEVWKGTRTEKVEFLATPTWTCDISEANKGETALLFLTKSKKSRRSTITHAGRGRMPLRTVDGKTYATFWPEVRLPDGTPTIDGPDPEADFIRSAEVEKLRDLVRAALQKKKGE